MVKHHNSHSSLEAKIMWHGPEYIYQRKTWVWYALVGLVFLGLILLFLFIHSWFASLAIILTFWLFLTYAEKRPKIVVYKIDKNGITIDERELAYSEIHSFTIDSTHGTPLIILDTNYPLSFPLALVLKDVEIEDVTDFLIEHLPIRNEFSFIRWLTHFTHY